MTRNQNSLVAPLRLFSSIDEITSPFPTERIPSRKIVPDGFLIPGIDRTVRLKLALFLFGHVRRGHDMNLL